MCYKLRVIGMDFQADIEQVIGPKIAEFEFKETN